MDLRIALAGNPNCGKTTLFNALTGSNQFVGNWPGVTVEKKEGKLKKHDGVIITDLPGIYSLSPYTLEEVVARNYLITERPDAILNIIDGTNLERNLYLTTQLTELGIPVVVAINMMDVVRKNGDKINTAELSHELGCMVVEISALKGTGIAEAATAAIDSAKKGKSVPMHTFSGTVEHAIAHIVEAAVHNLPEEQQRWYAIKIFERDDKVLEQINLDKATLEHIETDIKAVETEMDDDAESIITNERYVYIGSIIKGCYKKNKAGKLTTSDKIDKVVTNRFAALPIFAVIMFLVYYISVSTVGTFATDWANDGVFGGAWWVAPSAYFIGIAAIILSGIMLKKTKMFAGDPAPFVMELPAYHWPTVGNVLRSMWERAWSFIKKAGTIILLSSIIIWAGSCFGVTDGSFTFSTEMELNNSILGMIGNALCWIFSPLGFGNIKATVATIMGLVAKEEVVGVFGVLDFEGMTCLAAYSFLVFNLLCAPCFAAIGAIKREMNSAKWTWFAIGYQCVFAYAVSLMIYQIGSAFTGNLNVIGLIFAVAVLIFMLYMLFKPYKESTKLIKAVKVTK